MNQATRLPAGVWLNVGSGPDAPAGWVNIDGSWQAWLAARPLLARGARAATGRPTGHWPRGIVCRDVRRGLGLRPASAAVIYSSHFIEHLTRGEAAAFLAEAYRVLAPGGVCRVVTPDLAALVQQYLAAGQRGDAGAADRFVSATLLPSTGQGPRGPLGWYRARTRFETHKWLYDGGSLKRLFREAGFAAPEEREALDSRVPRDRLAEVEHPDRIVNGAGVVVEAVR
jgi:SAM-dependent methyltransferase